MKHVERYIAFTTAMAASASALFVTTVSFPFNPSSSSIVTAFGLACNNSTFARLLNWIMRGIHTLVVQILYQCLAVC